MNFLVGRMVSQRTEVRLLPDPHGEKAPAPHLGAECRIRKTCCQGCKIAAAVEIDPDAQLRTDPTSMAVMLSTARRT